MNRTTRREALGAGLFTALAGVAAVTVATPDGRAAPNIRPGSDGPLLAACAGFMDMQREIEATYHGLAGDDPEEIRLEAVRDRLFNDQAAAMRHIATLRGTTPAAHQARAQVIAEWIGLPRSGRPDTSPEEWYVLPLLRDLIGEGA